MSQPPPPEAAKALSKEKSSSRTLPRFLTPPPFLPQGSHDDMADSADSPQLVHVSMQVTMPVQQGQSVHAVVFRTGLTEVVAFYTSPDLYPVHRSQHSVALKAGTTVTYRYAIHAAGKFLKWADDDVRTLLVRADGVGSQHVKDSPAPVDDAHLRSDPPPEASAKPAAPVKTTLHPSEGVLVVSFYLPIIMTRLRRGVWQVSMDENSLLFRQPSPFSGSVVDRMRARFVGAPPCKVPADERTHVSRALEKFGCVPVFLEDDIERLSLEYCEGTLRNVYYGFVDVYGRVPTKWWNPNAQMGSWYAYLQAGKAFAGVVQGLYDERTMVWVHGYELIPCLPQLARKLHATGTRVGFSLHRPFPSSEIFRTLSVRVELLRAILSANLITFHLYEYVRHFTTCCRRILGLDDESVGAGEIYLDVDGRRVFILALHGGLDPVHIMRSLRSTAVCMRVREWLERTGQGRVMVAGLDFGGPLDGIRTKLAAFERLLAVRPEWADKLCLVQWVVNGSWGGPGGGGLAVKLPAPLEQGLPPALEDECGGSPWEQQACMAIVERVNATRAVPAIYLEVLDAVPPLAERLALFAAADVLLQTPLREGVSMFPMEFMLASAQTHGFCAVAPDETEVPDVPDADSSLTTESAPEPTALAADVLALDALPQQPVPVLVLSEFSAHVTALSGALRVNPWRVDGIVDALVMALEMGREERDARFAADLVTVRRRTATRWAEHILTKIKEVSQREDRTPDVVVGMGLNIRLVRASTVAARLDTDKVVKAFSASRKRVLFLDYGGTTVIDDLAVADASNRVFSFRPQGGVLYPTGEMLGTLEALGRENTVYIMSGRTKGELETAFAAAPHVGLVAEHGFYTRRPHAATWERLNDHFDLRDWMETTVNLMQVYTKRTHGTYVERKESMVLWQYRDADPEFGARQAHELHFHLQFVLQDFNVDIVNGKGYVEVRPAGCDKGRAAKAIFEEHDFDFVAVFGDDQADEPMFLYFKSVSEKTIDLRSSSSKWAAGTTGGGGGGGGAGEVKARSPAIFTCIVGVQNQSSARFHVNEVADVLEVLQALERANARRHIGSVLDLAGIDDARSPHALKMHVAASVPNLSSTPSAGSSERISSGAVADAFTPGHVSEGTEGDEEPLEF